MDLHNMPNSLQAAKNQKMYFNYSPYEIKQLRGIENVPVKCHGGLPKRP